ncbi:prepilin-type N-terminal cleavage/methylation domain-containing protein [bacterium]|nr:prepilin-type N-terminal cleavage/methylation domain-containing protein [bacterium]
MKKIKAFTLIEVMVSIFVFSSAMIGFMAFHVYTKSVLFEQEMFQVANALASNMLEEINAMSYSGFREHFITNAPLKEWREDKEFVDSNGESSGTSSGAFGKGFVASPFNSFGKPSPDANDNYRFYRAVKVTAYAERTQRFVQKGTYLSTLYEVEVRVAWPKSDYPAHSCDKSGFNDKCESITIPLIRSAENYR